jgi:hypothetical protein
MASFIAPNSIGAPNTGSTLAYDNGVNKTSVSLSTHMLIMVGSAAVGAIQTLQVSEKRSVVMCDEVGHDGHIDSSPNKSTDISGSCRRIRFDRLRITEAFSRGFLHVASQVYPFDIVIIDKQKSDVKNQISTVIKNVWITGIDYSLEAQDWIITDNLTFEAETIFSVLNGGQDPRKGGSAAMSAAVGGERGIPHSAISVPGFPNIEQLADTGAIRGSLSANGLIDLGVGNTLF